MFSKVKQDLEGLRSGKANIEAHLAKINIQIDSLVQTHNALAPLLGEPLLPANSAADTSLESLASASISHRVRSVLDANVGESFTATTMRDRLALQGWDWSKYVNPNATLHTVMMRLAKAGNAVEDTSRVATDGSKSFYSAKRLPPYSAKEMAEAAQYPSGTLQSLVNAKAPSPISRLRNLNKDVK